MLRHYDEIGLLKPAWVDPANQYRYYSADQLPRLNRIVALKDLGFSLEQIATLLKEDLSTEQLKGMLKLRRAELEAEQEAVAGTLAQIDARLNRLQVKAFTPGYEVTIRSIPTQRMAGIRQRIKLGSSSVSDLFEELETYVAGFGARAPLPPVMLYHDEDYPEGGEDIEVMVPIERRVPPSDRISVRDLEAVERMACLVHTGGYDRLWEAFSVLLGWVESNGHGITGPTREVFLRFGADQMGYSLPDAYVTDKSEEYVTELQIPVGSASERRASPEEGGNQ